MSVGRLVGAAAASLILMAVGCSHRIAGECVVACGADDLCPEDSTCRADGYCHTADDTAVCEEGRDLPDAAPPSDAETGGDAADCDGMPDRIADSDPRDIAIPDGDPVGVNRTISVDTACVTVESIQVRVEIVHEFGGDIEIELTSPGGDTEVLLKSSDDPTPDVFATFDAATLAAGESAQGDWVLNVSDVFDTDIGTLQFWSIGINMPAP